MQREPSTGLEVGQPLLGKGRHLGRAGEPLAAGYAERLEPAFPHLRHGRHIQRDLDIAGEFLVSEEVV